MDPASNKTVHLQQHPMEKSISSAIRTNSIARSPKSPRLPASNTTTVSPRARKLAIQVDLIAWPSPPPGEKRLSKRQKPSQEQSSVGVFASREVQNYAADGISVMPLLMNRWHQSLGRDLKYFRSFSVYGQVKLEEARNATYSVYGDGPNNTVTITSWELLTQLFSTIPPPAGPALISVLAHLVHPLFSNVSHVLQHIEDVASAAEVKRERQTAAAAAASSSSMTTASSFDVGAITYQEINTQLQNKIQRLTIQSAALNHQRQAAAKEAAKRVLEFNGTISIWQKSLKKLFFECWIKSIKIDKQSGPKLQKLLRPERMNPIFIRRITMYAWRSVAHNEKTNRLLPMSQSWETKADVLEAKLSKRILASKKQKQELRDLLKEVNLTGTLIKNKIRQIDLLANKLTLLDENMEPVKRTLKLFADAAQHMYQLYSETLSGLIQLGRRSTSAPIEWIEQYLGMGLGNDVQTGHVRRVCSRDITTYVPEMFAGDKSKRRKNDKHKHPSPATNFIVVQWSRDTKPPPVVVKQENDVEEVVGLDLVAGEDDEGGENGKDGKGMSKIIDGTNDSNGDTNGGDSDIYTSATHDVSIHEPEVEQSLETFFGTREQALSHLKPVTERSQKSDRPKQLSAAGLMHHFVLKTGLPPSVDSDLFQLLSNKLAQQKNLITHAEERSVDLDTNIVAGVYENDPSGKSRAELAHAALDHWTQASKELFLMGGALGKALDQGCKSTGGLKFGTHVQSWHMISRHCYETKERQRRRQAARNQEKDVDVLSLAVAIYGNFDKKRLSRVVEADLHARMRADATASKLPVDQDQVKQEVIDLANLTSEFAPEIRGWYIRYSSIKGMGPHDFSMFTKQIKVLSRNFKLVDIDLVRVASGAGDDDGMLSPPEFVEALIRLSLKRYSSAAPVKGVINEALFSDSEDEEGDESEGEGEGGRGGNSENAAKMNVLKSKRPVDRVRRLLTENVSKHAHQVDIDSFRARFADPDVQEVLIKRRRWLLGKFREYCAQDGAQASSSDQAMYTMNLVEWELFLRDHEVFDRRFRNRSSATIFVCAQAPHAMDEAGSLEDALESNQELIFQEFLEAIVALAHFRLPDPFVPLGIRVAAMLDQLDEAKPLNRYFASTKFARTGVAAATALQSAFHKK